MGGGGRWGGGLSACSFLKKSYTCMQVLYMNRKKMYRFNESLICVCVFASQGGGGVGEKPLVLFCFDGRPP